MVIETAPASRQRTRHDESLADFLPDAYLETDQDGRIRAANAAVSALIGYARGYAVGKPIHVLFHPSSLDTVRDFIVRAAEDTRPREFEALLRGRREGPPRDARVRLGPIRDTSGALVGLRWILRDVTEEKRTAARLAAAESRHAQQLRTATMELEATVRLLQARLAPLSPAGAIGAAGG
jgi:two-component system sensor histidine kinase VicK